MEIVTSSDIEEKLRHWQSGKISAAELHDWAEDRYSNHRWETESDAVNEVLAQLDMMNMNLITTEDISVLSRALTSTHYLMVLNEHFKSIDMSNRKIQLANDPLYAPFCK